MKQNLLFISKGCPNFYKSAGDLRSLRILSILKDAYNITCWFSSADYGLNDIKALGITPVQNGAVQVFDEIMAKNKPDKIIISHWATAKRYIEYIRKRTNIEIILDTIDLEFLRCMRECEFRKTKYDERLMNAEFDIYRRADSLILASDPDKDELMKYMPRKKMTVIPCLFELNKNDLANTNETYTVCNWQHAPNIDATIWLCENIIPYVDTKLSIIGKHPPEQIAKFSSNKIELCGWVSNMTSFCKNKSACLAAILYGAGCNGKIGESISMGIPVVTTSLGALPYGLTSESAMIADNSKDYLEAVKIILTDKTRAKKLADNAFELIKKYTVEFYKETILQL